MQRSPQVIRQEAERIDHMADLLIEHGVALDEDEDCQVAVLLLLRHYRPWQLVSERRSFLDEAIVEARRRDALRRAA